MLINDLKESYPIKTAEFSRTRGTDDKPVFIWWILYIIRKRNIIIGQGNSRGVLRITHKYSFELPYSIAQSKKLDKDNKTPLWSKSLNKEMFNVDVVFKVLDDSQNTVVG